MFHGVIIRVPPCFMSVKRINLCVPDEFHKKILAEKPVHQMLSSFCVDLIACALDEGGYGRAPQRDSGREAVKTAVVSKSAVSSNLSSPPGHGLGVGRGVQGGTPRKGYPEQLKPFKDAIEAYWRVKRGSKSETAWNRLMNNLMKFLEKYGKDVVEDQLGKAESGKWKGIEISNYENMQPAKKQGEMPAKHPASRDWTAERLQREREQSPGILDNLI